MPEPDAPAWTLRTIGRARVWTKRVSPEVEARMPDVKRTVAERTFWEVLRGPARPGEEGRA